MTYIVLYSGACEACSKVARMVSELSVPGLEARPFTDPQVLALLADSGLAVPARPALLVRDGDEVRLLRGLAMRRRLAGVIGWNRAGTLARLLAAEGRARLGRPAEPDAPSRRGIIGGALATVAGVTGWALTSGVAAAAPTAESSIRLAEPADAEKVLATPAARQAAAVFGPAEHGVFEMPGGDPVFVLMHVGGAVTFIDNAPGALRSGRPTALTSVPDAANPARFQFRTTGGFPLANMTVSDGGRLTATAVERRAHDLAIEPDITVSKAALSVFFSCLGAQVSIGCADNCASCATAHSAASAATACAQCALCGGKKAIGCAKQAF